MLEDIKKINGINNEEFDEIINTYIDGAKYDLEMTGIKKESIKEDDKLIYAAIVSYVQAFINEDKHDLYIKSYALQKDALRHYYKYQDNIGN